MLTLKKERYRAFLSAKNTEKVFILTGYVLETRMEEFKEKIADLERFSGKKVLQISAVAGQGVTECLRSVNKFITRERKSNIEIENEEITEVEPVKKTWSPLD